MPEGVLTPSTRTSAGVNRTLNFSMCSSRKVSHIYYHLSYQKGGEDSVLLNSYGKNTVNGHKTPPSLSSKHNYTCISKLETISPFEFFFICTCQYLIIPAGIFRHALIDKQLIIILIHKQDKVYSTDEFNTRKKNITLLIPFIEGFEAEALSYCAKPFLGVFTYMHTSTSVTCGLEWGESLLDVCNNNRTNLIFDYNLCSTKVAFSGKGLRIPLSNDTPPNIKQVVFTY